MSHKIYTGKRGMAFEDRLNATNRLYQTRKIAILIRGDIYGNVIEDSGRAPLDYLALVDKLMESEVG